MLLEFLFFPKFLKYWKLKHIKNLIINITANLKSRELWYIGQTPKLKGREK